MQSWTWSTPGCRSFRHPSSFVTATRLPCRALLLLLDTSFAPEEFILHRLLFYCSVCVLTRTVSRLCFCWQHTWNDRHLRWRHILIFHWQECCFINFCLCPKPSGIWKLYVHSEKPWDMVRATVILSQEVSLWFDYNAVIPCGDRLWEASSEAGWPVRMLNCTKKQCQPPYKLHCLLNCFEQNWNLHVLSRWNTCQGMLLCETNNRLSTSRPIAKLIDHYQGIDAGGVRGNEILFLLVMMYWSGVVVTDTSMQERQLWYVSVSQATQWRFLSFQFVSVTGSYCYERNH